MLYSHFLNSSELRESAVWDSSNHIVTKITACEGIMLIRYNYSYIELVMQLTIIVVYSGTSDSGPSDERTQYNRPLYKGHRSRSQKFGSL